MRVGTLGRQDERPDQRRVPKSLGAPSLGERGGACDPGLLARQLSLVFDGGSARAGIGADRLTGLIAPTVTTLLDAAGVR